MDHVIASGRRERGNLFFHKCQFSNLKDCFVALLLAMTRNTLQCQAHRAHDLLLLPVIVAISEVGSFASLRMTTAGGRVGFMNHVIAGSRIGFNHTQIADAIQ
jgi:hypothetical protein